MLSFYVIRTLVGPEVVEAYVCAVASAAADMREENLATTAISFGLQVIKLPPSLSTVGLLCSGPSRRL